ncbi:Hsp20 family protein [Vibrio lentus]|uniref:Heat-shock protein n=1 Tax=Vibrio lentus TaxID=136468 RepID=A0AB36XRT6_9VIBR|nr:Hsp20 family protein [Vibrio lentus]MCC4840261.1 Hsp20 family protein [Vibrio lentus]PMI10718.1 heat-shock protein [Vibrio lentus]PMK32459.1 heat-shock protein [Vibrio lentus]PMK49135.1 heat-shock protein [Vibrio lentus]PML27504.1 heat-shock protein [Vibrio lentus]
MNSIDLTPLYRNSVGFDRLASLLDHALTSETTVGGYPPYNIEVLSENRYAITLAVAGFVQEELDIQVEKGVLTVRGNKSSEPESKYLYQGIANRTFERKFNLADYVEVTDADLSHGLLTITLVKEIPEEMKPKSIAINQGGNVLEHKSEGTEDSKVNKK